MGSIFILNKRNALKYLRKPIHEVLDNKIIYININDNNCVHKIHNSMLMFRRNIVTYNIYFSDSLTSKNRLATDDAIDLCRFLSTCFNERYYNQIVISCPKNDSRPLTIAQSIIEAYGIHQIEYYYDEFCLSFSINSELNRINAWAKLCMKQAFQYNKSKQIELKNKSDFDKFADLLKEKKEIWIKTKYITNWYYGDSPEVSRLRKVLHDGFMKCSLSGDKFVLSDGFSDYYEFSYHMLKECFWVTLYFDENFQSNSDFFNKKLYSEI